MMKKLGLALFAAFLGLAPAQAQQVSMPPPAGTIAVLCAYNSSLPTVSTGNVAFVQCDANGQLLTSGGGGITSPLTTEGADNVSNTLTGVQTYARIECYDGATWDRCTQIIPGTAGTPSSNVLSVQGLSGMTPVSVSTSDPCSSAQKSSKAISITSATTTSLVAVSGSTAVYVCGFSVTIAPSATSADTIAFEYGTGAACTSPTLLTGTFGNGDLTTAAPPAVVSYGGGAATVFSAPASNGICALTSGTTVNVQGVLTYVQQ